MAHCTDVIFIIPECEQTLTSILALQGVHCAKETMICMHWWCQLEWQQSMSTTTSLCCPWRCPAGLCPGLDCQDWLHPGQGFFYIGTVMTFDDRATNEHIADSNNCNFGLSQQQRWVISQISRVNTWSGFVLKTAQRLAKFWKEQELIPKCQPHNKSHWKCDKSFIIIFSGNPESFRNLDMEK